MQIFVVNLFVGNLLLLLFSPRFTSQSIIVHFVFTAIAILILYLMTRISTNQTHSLLRLGVGMGGSMAIPFLSILALALLEDLSSARTTFPFNIADWAGTMIFLGIFWFPMGLLNYFLLRHRVKVNIEGMPNQAL